MTRSLKTLFLILALAALPLRGVAAVAMWHCAQEQHDAMSTSGGHAGHHDAHASTDDAGHLAPASDDVAVSLREQLRQPMAGKPKNERDHFMLYTIAVVLLVLWLLGLVTSYTLGGFIHILLVVAVVMVLVNLISGRRAL